MQTNKPKQTIHKHQQVTTNNKTTRDNNNQAQLGAMETLVTKCRALVATRKFSDGTGPASPADVKDFLIEGAAMVETLDEFLTLAKPFLPKKRTSASSAASTATATPPMKLEQDP